MPLTAAQLDAVQVDDDDPNVDGPRDCEGADADWGFLCSMPQGHPGKRHIAVGTARTVLHVWERL